MYQVYRHVRLDKNEPFYIGIGKMSSTYNRSIDKRRNKIWQQIVSEINNKYEVEIIFENISYLQAIEKEKEFIKLYGKIINNSGTLANILDCGGGMIKGYMSDENKNKLKIRMINNSYAKNSNWDEKRKEKQSLRSQGNTNNLGKIWSEKVKQNMSKGHIGNTATKGYKWITNGIINKRIKSDVELPNDFRYGIKKNAKQIININK
jgi:hypothetical protein